MPSELPRVVDRLVAAVNDHDIDALVGCFADDYKNETPAHPLRGFSGSAQVRRNWAQIFAGVPDIRAELLRTAVDGDTIWTEWEMAGNRVDGELVLMRGPVIFTITADLIRAARFYLESVERGSGGVDAAVERMAGART